MTGGRKASRIVGHATKAVGVHLFDKRPELRMAARGIAEQEHDRGRKGRDLGDEFAPARDELSWIGLACLQLIRSLLSRHRAPAFEGPGAHGADQPWLAAERLVDGVHRHARVPCDGRDRGGPVAVTKETSLNDLDDSIAVPTRLRPAQAGIVGAPAALDSLCLSAHTRHLIQSTRTKLRGWGENKDLPSNRDDRSGGARDQPT